MQQLLVRQKYHHRNKYNSSNTYVSRIVRSARKNVESTSCVFFPARSCGVRWKLFKVWLVYYFPALWQMTNHNLNQPPSSSKGQKLRRNRCGFVQHIDAAIRQWMRNVSRVHCCCWNFLRSNMGLHIVEVLSPHWVFKQSSKCVGKTSSQRTPGANALEELSLLQLSQQRSS